MAQVLHVMGDGGRSNPIALAIAQLINSNKIRIIDTTMNTDNNEAPALEADPKVVAPLTKLRDLPPKRRRRAIIARAQARAIERSTQKKAVATANLSEDEREAIIERRTEMFSKLFDRILAEELSASDMKAISNFATALVVKTCDENKDLDDLSDLKIEPENLTEYEYVAIVKKANYALNTILNNRIKYRDGVVFWKNRHQKRGLAKRILKGRSKTGLVTDVTVITVANDGSGRELKRERIVRPTTTKWRGRGGSRQKSAIASRAVAETKQFRMARVAVNS